MLLGLALVGAGLLSAAPARAQDVRTDSGLALVPADASFYTAMLRNKEQIDAVLKSKAYKKLLELQSVKMALAQLEEEKKKPDGPFSVYKKFMEDKENQDLQAVLKDAVSSEIFFYGGSAWADMFLALQQANSAQSLAPAEAALSGGDPSKAQFRAVLQSLQKNRKLLRIPDLVIGFKLSDPKKAEAQLKRLQGLAEAFLPMLPPLKGRFKKDANGMLVLNLEGSMIPWDDASIKDFEDKPGEFNDLVTHLKAAKATVSLGVKNSYLLVAVTSAADALGKFGAKGTTLGEQPDLKVLGKHASKPITSVGYVSKAFRKSATSGADLGSTATSLKRMLEKADLPAARKKAIEKDLDDLVAQLKKYQPEVGAVASVEYMIDDGYEGYRYDLSNQEKVKGARLHLLEHFGGNPILGVAGAMPVSGEGYEFLVKTIKTTYGHVEAVFMDKADDNAKDEYKKFTKNFFPLVEKLNQTTTKEFLPALGPKGGIGLVIDAKWTSKQWIQMAPPTPKPMPMIEVGLLLGLSDAAKFQKALKEYRLTFNEIWEKVREASRDNVPDFKIPAAESSKVKGGTLFFYPIPEDAGVDKQVTPTLGVGTDAAAFTLSKAHAERLITSTPLKVTKGPLAGKKDVVSGCYFDFHALLAALEPWTEVAASAAGASDDKEAKKKAEMVARDVKSGLEILRVFHGYQSATYVEGGMLVTHSQTIVKDR